MQELIYDKKQRFMEEYSEYVRWMNMRTKPEIVLRSAVAENLSFISLKGIISERKDNAMKQFLSGIYAIKLPIVVVFSVKCHKTEILLGCEKDRIETLKELAIRVLGIRYSEYSKDSNSVFGKKRFLVESVLVGDAAYKDDAAYNVMDLLLTKGFADECSVVITASPLSRGTGTTLSDYYNNLCTELNILTSRQITSRDDKDSVSYTEESGILKRFLKIAEEYQKKYEQGTQEGLFMTSIKVFSNSVITNDLVSGTFISQSEETEYPETLQQVYMSDCRYCGNLYTSKRNVSINGKQVSLPELSNFHTASELSYFTRLPTRDTLGFYKRVIPDFDMERVFNEGIVIGSILKSGREVSDYYLPMSELNRNALVSGLVGSGKTNTIEHMVMELNKEGVPVLIIEPVKTEYYELANTIDDLKVISVGGINNGLQLNPFQPVDDKVTLQKHVDALYSALMAAFEWVPPMPQIVEETIYKVYKDNGFDVANNIRNPKGNYPTIEQAYWTIQTVVKEKRFDVRLENDLIGCISARFNSLRLGNKGRTLNVRRSMPMDTIFNHNCVIELEEIQDEEVRSFIIGLLLANLREYCMLRDTSHLAVQHCTVIEEAHTLFKKVDASSSTSQAKGVRVFSEMLKTLRAKGESFIIVDQVPTELTEDVIKNTNLKISHRIVAADDKAVLGKTMNCTEEQEAYQTVLNRGEALVFSEGDYRPKLVKIPLCNYEKAKSRDDILRSSVIVETENNSLYNMNISCLYCDRDLCPGNEEMIKDIDPELIEMWSDRVVDVANEEEAEELCMDIAVALKREGKLDYLKCVLTHILEDLELSNQELYELYSHFRKIKID